MRNRKLRNRTKEKKRKEKERRKEENRLEENRRKIEKEGERKIVYAQKFKKKLKKNALTLSKLRFSF